MDKHKEAFDLHTVRVEGFLSEARARFGEQDFTEAVRLLGDAETRLNSAKYLAWQRALAKRKRVRGA